MKHRHVLLAAIVVIALLGAGRDLLRNHRADLTISRWQSRVQAGLTTSSTPEDAKRHLEQLGFDSEVRLSPIAVGKRSK